MSTGGVLYLRDPAMYPGNDPLSYAARLGCRGVALQPRIARHRALIAPAVTRFGAGGVELFDLPSEYTPRNWRATFNRAAGLASDHGVGVLVDLETASQWARAHSELVALGAAMRDLAELGVRVGVTSVPMHPSWQELADIADGGAAIVGPQTGREPAVWGSVQLYGRGFPRDRYGAQIETWRTAFPGGVRPSIALGSPGWPGLSVSEYAAYLADVRDAMEFAGLDSRDVLMWHGQVPPEDGAYHQLARAHLTGGHVTVPDGGPPVVEETPSGRGMRVAGCALLVLATIGGAIALAVGR